MKSFATTTAFTNSAKHFALLCFLLLTGCNRTPPQPAPTQAADEAAVRQTGADWSKAAQSKNVDDWVAYYSDDAVVLPPNDKKASDKDSIRKAIAAVFALPGLSLSWEPAKVEVARSGDLAYTQGAYVLAVNDAHGKPTTDHGKTVEIWKKQPDGRWKCAVDMWSSDLPAPPQ